MTLYVATINTPGYLPEAEPYYTESATTAWEYLRDELAHDAEADEDSERDRDYYDAIEKAAHLAADPEGPRTGLWVHDAAAPHDLGLVYSVDVYDGPCEWLALCDRVAEIMLPHPILGEVPTCQRCADKVARLSA